MSRPRRIAVVGDGSKPEVHQAVVRVSQWIAQRGNGRADDGPVHLVPPDLEGRLDLEALDCELVLSFGGDGSLLQTARRMGTRQKPVAGVNYGRLGFLADLSPEDIEADLAWILDLDIPTTPRMLLEAHRVDAAGRTERFLALNDVVISQAAVKRMIEISLAIGGEQVTTYRGDGLIVATPVGSTAHSLSAGGPIVHPAMRAILLTPICPHLLSNRPLVISGSEHIALHQLSTSVEAVLTIDGQELRTLAPGDTVTIGAAPFDLRLVLPPDWTYYRTLQRKLGWGVWPQQIRANP